MERRRAGRRAGRAGELPVPHRRGRLPRRRLRTRPRSFYDDAEVVQPSLPERAGLLAAWHADDEALWSQPGTPPTDEFLGATVVTMNYTSGTTGRPKGIERVRRRSRPPSTHPTRSPRSGGSPTPRAPPVRARVSHRTGRVRADEPRRRRLGRDHAALHRRVVPRAHPARARHDLAHGAGQLHPHPRGAVAGLRPHQRGEDPPRGRAVPARSEAADHGGVPARHGLGVLRRQRRACAPSSRPRSGCASRAASVGRSRASRSPSATTTATRCRPARSARCTRRGCRECRSSSTTMRPRRPPTRGWATSSPCATSGPSTRTATSSWPTGAST